MQAATSSGAVNPAHLSTIADLDAAMRARSDARRRREAEGAAKRLARKRAYIAAHPTHVVAMTRMAALATAAELLGSAKNLADALGIDPRSVRKKTGAERGVSNDDLLAAADALDARASALIQHAQKLRDEATKS